jgi:hypothetical protein
VASEGSAIAEQGVHACCPQVCKPRDFAQQINLSMDNCWGIVRALVDLALKLEDGKYLLVKDPNKPLLRLYSVPEDAFQARARRAFSLFWRMHADALTDSSARFLLWWVLSLRTRSMRAHRSPSSFRVHGNARMRMHVCLLSVWFDSFSHRGFSRAIRKNKGRCP